MTKQLIALLSLAVAGVAFNAQAATTASPAQAAQQQKMKTCAAANKGKKGADYKAGMKACLSNKADDGASAPAVAAAPAATAASVSAKSAQQDKMKQCNADAKGKKGAERKAFMKDCLAK
jgi:hypothetical protein